MELAKVVGTVVATRKNSEMGHFKLLLTENTEPDGTTNGKYFVCVDIVDAGIGDLVIIVRGSSARTTTDIGSRPIDGSIVAIVDTINMNGKTVYQK